MQVALKLTRGWIPVLKGHTHTRTPNTYTHEQLITVSAAKLEFRRKNATPLANNWTKRTVKQTHNKSRWKATAFGQCLPCSQLCFQRTENAARSPFVSEPLHFREPHRAHRNNSRLHALMCTPLRARFPPGLLACVSNKLDFLQRCVGGCVFFFFLVRSRCLFCAVFPQRPELNGQPNDTVEWVRGLNEEEEWENAYNKRAHTITRALI